MGQTWEVRERKYMREKGRGMWGSTLERASQQDFGREKNGKYGELKEELEENVARECGTRQKQKVCLNNYLINGFILYLYLYF